MDYKGIIAKLNQKKVKDYSFTVLFFIVFSVFLIFAIRPNLITAIELRNELIDLKQKDAEYESLIQKIVEHQTTLESQRKKLYVLDEAIPQKYLLHYNLIDDYVSAATSSGITLTSLRVPEVILVSKKDPTGLKTIPTNIAMVAPETNISTLFQLILQQRRIKQIDEVVLSRNKAATTSGDWDSDVKINTFYYKL